MNEDTTKEMSSDDRIITAINVLRVDMQNQINDLRADMQGRFDTLDNEVNQIHREIALIHQEY